MSNVISRALKQQYRRTMNLAYAYARAAARGTSGTRVLDCGSSSGHEREATFGDQAGRCYLGLEWSREAVSEGRARGLEIQQADLNAPLPVESGSQDCVIAYSVVEHLYKPCAFLKECHRVLASNGTLVVLTPNISTYFTVLQLLLGRMPSSGPHPDSIQLIDSDAPTKVSDVERDDMDSDTPQHRHLVVFSFRSLRRFLTTIGFTVVQARVFGYYPLPQWLQPVFERVDKWHCHQMVLVCRKRP